ncbi:MAG: DUF2079 domain-containing protein [Actinobacteria bacterium]|nr:MAG: DUF2079 domain-containing protein [Actinomycetota bacterium]
MPNFVVRVRRVSPWTIVMLVAVAAYAIYFSVTTVQIHRGLGTSAYDFGLYDQGIWLLSRGKTPFVTLMGRNLFGDHTSFILVFVVPLMWLCTSTSMLFVVQSVVIACGAIPVYAYARKRLESDALGCAMACSYLLYPAVSWTNVENFHPDSFLGLLIGVALWAALGRKWRWYGVAVLLALLVKEDVALVVVPLGVFVALRRDVRIGIATILGSMAAALLFFLVVIRYLTGSAFRNSWRIPFGGFGGLVKTAFTSPATLFSYLTSDGRVTYLAQMLFPTGFVFLVAPSVAAIGIIVLLSNILSTYYYQYQIHYHYSLVVAPILVFGNVYAIGRLGPLARRKAVMVVGVSALVAAFLLAPLPLARNQIQKFSPSSPAVTAAHQLFAQIPPDAVISVYHPLSAQLARRERVYVFPNPFQRSLYGPDIFAKGDRLPFAHEIEYVMLPIVLTAESQAVWQLEVDDYVWVGSNEWWILYRHR